MLSFKCKKFEKMKSLLLKSKSFTVSGVTSFFRLILLNKIQEFSGKKILVVTSNEQSSLKLQSDYKKIFGKKFLSLKPSNKEFLELLYEYIKLQDTLQKALISNPFICPISNKACCAFDEILKKFIQLY